jgi:hypothetical protein
MCERICTLSYALDDLAPVLTANLTNDLPNPQSDVVMQNFVAIFGDPNQMITMVIGGVLAFVVLHDHTLQKNEPPTGELGSFFWRV